MPESLTAPRSHLVRALEADLIGPFRRGLRGPNGEDGIDSEELLKLPPSRWYLTGFLAPSEGREEEEESDEELGAGDDKTEEDTTDSAPEPKKKGFLPASLGVTVFVPKGVDSLEVTVRYATYDRVPSDPEDKKSKQVWKRLPAQPVTDTVLLSELEGEGVAVRDAGGLRIEGQVETLGEGLGVPPGTQAVSVFLVNRRAPDSAPGLRDRAYYFQVELGLTCKVGFEKRPDRSHEKSDSSDELVADLQYRETCEYAVGHGISVDIDASQNPVRHVRTTWLPKHEVRRVIAHDEPGVTVSMEMLAELKSAAEVRQHLSRLPEAYEQWIQDKRAVVLDSDERSGTRDFLLGRAADAAQRIRDGIALLEADADVREAFCLANRAMGLTARRKRPHDEPKWRLFQLAFVLLNVRGIAEPTHEDRERAELIFFPTGGGKTEAYLGVIAVTLILRRLRGRGAAHAGLGVAVVLRYTLRLLTLDQLGRAATLVCALESLRRKAPAQLGAERFSVGLWVGSSATSNTMTQVQKAVLEYQTGRSGNPAPLTNCPWCGSDIMPAGLTLIANGKATTRGAEEVRVGCSNDRCEFCPANHEGGIPVVFVDEHVYRELPSFLIGTVDKFAMIPWRGETGKLFGKVTGRTGRVFYNPTDGSKLPKGATALPTGVLPPDLIVQDELHLISGPLGTMVGLYETAVDYLCSRTVEGKLVRPKVIAATATVRRATEQMQALYARSQVDVFPPPGLDAMDTYFSLIDPNPENSGRLYVGVAAQGRSMKAILLRVYRVLVAAGAYADAAMPGDAADATTTVTGYFNSLRELGGMRRIAEDELRVRAEKAEDFRPIDFTLEHPWFKNRRLDGEPVELTSRESTTKIKKAKDRLDKRSSDPEHVDVLLASNMISVGVDIDRLGLMVVAGQPKTTAEYIQASSRVGRQVRMPGLVVTCMNIHKARDRSHYERFNHYHQTFYRRVEATSVTPFSGPALERGLAGALVAMARFTAHELTPADGVLAVEKHKADLDAVLQALARRALSQPGQTKTESDELVQDVQGIAKNLVATWIELMRSTDAEPVKRRYSRFDKEKTGGEPLLKQALDQNAPPRNSPEGRFIAPTSMRDVESTSHLWMRNSLGPFEGKSAKGDA